MCWDIDSVNPTVLKYVVGFDLMLTSCVELSDSCDIDMLTLQCGGPCVCVRTDAAVTG